MLLGSSLGSAMDSHAFPSLMSFPKSLISMHLWGEVVEQNYDTDLVGSLPLGPPLLPPPGLTLLFRKLQHRLYCSEQETSGPRVLEARLGGESFYFPALDKSPAREEGRGDGGSIRTGS